MTSSTSAKPRLWRLARIGYDRVRQRPVLLYPEGAMFINDSGKAILELCRDTARFEATPVHEFMALFAQ